MTPGLSAVYSYGVSTWYAIRFVALCLNLLLLAIWRQMNQHPQTNNSDATLLAQAYMLILSWPCPICGEPFPCRHDLEDGQHETETPDTGLKDSLKLEQPIAVVSVAA